MRELEYAKAIREALYQEMEIDDQIICFGEDVALYGGLWDQQKDCKKSLVLQEYLTLQYLKQV